MCSDKTYELVDGQHRLRCMDHLWAAGNWKPVGQTDVLTPENTEWPVLVVDAPPDVLTKMAHCKIFLCSVQKPSALRRPKSSVPLFLPSGFPLGRKRCTEDRPR